MTKCKHDYCYSLCENDNNGELELILRCLECNNKQTWNEYEYAGIMVLYHQSRSKEYNIYTKAEVTALEN